MNRIDQISATENFVKQIISGYDSGHDWWHIERVRGLARYINERENLADPFILDISVLLHDTVDSKFRKENSDDGYNIIESFLIGIELAEIKDQVVEAIKNVSFSNKNPSGNLKDPVYMILQDADRIDAIGAIGIARAFNYGGFRNNPIYIPGENSAGKNKSTIGHFYDKLLKLKDLMNTNTGKILAEERHRYLEMYLQRFYKEWEFAAITRD
jgi:uncharacterized protein